MNVNGGCYFVRGERGKIRGYEFLRTKFKSHDPFFGGRTCHLKIFNSTRRLLLLYTIHLNWYVAGTGQ